MSKEIFIVDDNADYQFIFFKLIKELRIPHAVKFFENARSCHNHMQLLQKKCTAEMPELVLIDLNMPGMNGLQLLKKLKEPI